MNRIDIAYGVVYRALDLKKDTFEDRLISQKKVFLLQMAGTDLGYRYVWYVKGPYSQDLASYMYANDTLFKNQKDLSKYALADDVQEKIDKVNQLAEKKETVEMDDAEWYELLASLLFIYRNKNLFAIKNGNDDDVIWALSVEKDEFKEKEEACRYALEVLRQEGFLS